MVRCFVGYLLPEEVKNEIVELQNRIEKWPLKCKFVEIENLHINFSFLGEIDENQINEISKKIDYIGGKFDKFEIEIDGLIAIPSPNYIRVLALSIFENEFLKRVFREVVKEIGGDSKPPHITLCRVKSIENKNEVKGRVEDEKNKTHGKFVIDKIQLIKSELSKSGPIYSIIHQAEFS
ncbi:MAG: RNA 2',3'-cyclic phosphodiesterase [Candidatus Aenigmatarchaeota archaeon]